MHQNYQDAMAMIGRFGKPDLFLTFTCNPLSGEKNMKIYGPNEKANDRPDLVSRIFKIKLNELMHNIKVKGVLGKSISHVQVTELQKRGLPHAYPLIHLSQEYKLQNSDGIDTLISTEIPDPNTQPCLYEVVKSCMVHGPCGPFKPDQMCMIDGKCTKKFPKEFIENTQLLLNKYPKYRRQR